MLRVLQHYLPVRTALLVLSEWFLFMGVIGAGMSQHLWGTSAGGGLLGKEVMRELAHLGLTPGDARLRCLLSTALIVGLCQIALGFNRLYEYRISNSRYERASRFVEAAGAALFVSVGVVFIATLWGFERLLDFPGLPLSQTVQTLVVSIVTAFMVAYVWRMLYHWLMRRVNLNQRTLIIGSRGPAHSIAKQILSHPESGYELAGMIPEPDGPGHFLQTTDLGGVDDSGEGGKPKLVSADNASTPETERLMLDSVALLERRQENRGVAMGSRATNGDSPRESLIGLARKMNVDLIIVALEDRRQMLPTEDLLRCRLAGIDVREREQIYEQITGKIAVEAMRPSYLIFNEGFQRHPWAELLKRSVDVVCSLLILLVTWPLMLLAAIAVRFDSPGPILFRQERIGQDDQPFTLAKFRSMRADAEKETGPVWSSADDPRITRFGRFMRKTRIDELPQLFNVLSGSMSLVGPRPERKHFVDDLAQQIPYYNQRHIVKPGLTGWAQINYPYGNTLEDALQKLQYDLFYIKNQSFLFDLSILFNTIRTVVLRKGT